MLDLVVKNLITFSANDIEISLCLKIAIHLEISTMNVAIAKENSLWRAPLTIKILSICHALLGKSGSRILTNLRLDSFPVQATYDRLCDVSQMIADLLDIVHKINKYQARHRCALGVCHALHVATAKLDLHAVEIFLVRQCCSCYR